MQLDKNSSLIILQTNVHCAKYFGCATMYSKYSMDFLIDGQVSSFCPDQHGGEAFNPNNATQTPSIFAKLGNLSKNSYV